VVDLDNDGKKEILGVPNIEKHVPYVTQAYGLFVLQGSHGDGSLSAMRKTGWEVLPRGDFPIQVSGWYPPSGVPAAMTADIQGNSRPEIVVSLNDGYMYSFDSNGNRNWRYNYRHGRSIMYSSEPIAADMNMDGEPEIIFTTYGDPDTSDSGYLMILGADGFVYCDIRLPKPGHNGNGNGAPAVSLGDLDGDGDLEIFAQTFDHGIDVFTVPVSDDGTVVWPTARGNNLRSGSW
jgi:hypothetical protein